MPPADTTRERILNGALEALAILGSRRFSMSAVSERAKISRGTLYRYFPTKEDLLAGMTAHMAHDFPRYLRRQLDGDLDEETRVQRVADAMREYVHETPVLGQLLDAEPLFVKSFYNEQFHGLVRLVAAALVPPGQAKQTVDWPEVMSAAEVLVRVAISYRVVGPERGVLVDRALTTHLAEMIYPTVEERLRAAGQAKR